MESKRVDFADLDLPKILYKYRCWDGFDLHKKILLDTELFLPSPKRFNDPFDCKIPVAYYLLESDHNLRKKYFPEMVKRHFPNYNQAQTDREVERLESERFYTDFRRMVDYDQSYYEEFCSRWGVFSMSATPLSTLMWAHYSNNHRGFCLGFDPKKLFSDSNSFGGGGEVTYKEKFPVIRPDQDFMLQSFVQMYTKSKEWEYEKEYRVDKLGGADSVVNYNSNALVEIYFGINMPTHERNEVFLAANSVNKKVSAFVVFPEQYSFDLNKEKYNP